MDENNDSVSKFGLFSVTELLQNVRLRRFSL